MDDDALRAYLDQHRTGATAVAQLVEVRIEQDRAPAWLRTFHDQLIEERGVVDQIADRLDAPPLTPTRVAGRLANGVVRLAMRAAWTLNPALRDLLEYETMWVGVQGKLALWRTLEVHADHPAVAGVDVEAYAARATEHAEHLERLRREAAASLR